MATEAKRRDREDPLEVEEEKLDERTRKYLANLARRHPFSLHFDTNAGRLTEDLASHWPKNAKNERTARQLRELIEGIIKPLNDTVHTSTPLRFAINVGQKPESIKSLPNVPSVHAAAAAAHGIVLHRLAKPNEDSLNRATDETPLGFTLLCEAIEPVVDPLIMELKQGGNSYQRTNQESNEDEEWRAGKALQLLPLSAYSHVSKLPLAAGLAAGAVVAETFLERQNRENREFFKKKDEEQRRQSQDQSNRIRQENDATATAAAAIAQVEAAFARIRSNPHSPTEIAALGGILATLRGVVADGRASAQLRNRAAGDFQIGNDLAAELRKIEVKNNTFGSQAATATATDLLPTQETSAPKNQTVQNKPPERRPEDAGAEVAALAAFETELARVNEDEWFERQYPQSSPEVAELRAAQDRLAGFQGRGGGYLSARAGADYELGRRELAEVMQPITPAQAVAAHAGELPPAQASLHVEHENVVMSQQPPVATQAVQASVELTDEPATLQATVMPKTAPFAGISSTDATNPLPNQPAGNVAQPQPQPSQATIDRAAEQAVREDRISEAATAEIIYSSSARSTAAPQPAIATGPSTETVKPPQTTADASMPPPEVSDAPPAEEQAAAPKTYVAPPPREQANQPVVPPTEAAPAKTSTPPHARPRNYEDLPNSPRSDPHKDIEPEPE